MTNKIEGVLTNKINIGITDEDRKTICLELNKLLADTYLLYLKTQNYHWNVTGPMFQSLHQLFENQYTEQAKAIDLIAERIRALGEFAPGSFVAFSKISSIKEESGVPSASEMIHNLVHANETVLSCAKNIIALSDSCEDEVTADFMIDRMQVHEKNAWMLRSLIAHQA
jgi:starvation-inducible DNA-binding protein